MEKDETIHKTARRRSDGEATHTSILETAMRIASIEGLASLTIGRLARELGISKSGVFAHFRSKERLQRETLEAAERVFEREVVAPGLAAPKGLGQVEGLCEAYLSYLERGVFPGGCFFAHVVAEFDAQPGPIHDLVEAGHRGWTHLMERAIHAAQQQGELNRGVDPAQLAFELLALLEYANYVNMLHKDAGAIEQGRRAVRTAIDRAKPT